MAASLNKDYNGMSIDFGCFKLHLINQNGKLGFRVSSNSKIEEPTAVVLPNRGLENEIYNVFRDFIARVIGKAITEGIEEIKKYPKDFIIIDNKKRAISLKGYDMENNFAILNITYDMFDKQIRINVNPPICDKTYYFPKFRDNKEYYGECLSCYDKMIENFNKLYCSLILREVSIINPVSPKFKAFKVTASGLTNDNLLNSVYLRNDEQVMAMTEDNEGSVHIYSPNDCFIIKDNFDDESESKVFNMVRETMELMFGHIALATVDQLRDIKVNFKSKKIYFDKVTLIYKENKIIFDFPEFEKNNILPGHAIIEMSGLRNAGISFDIKRLLYNLITNYKVTNKKGSTLGRRR